MLKLGMRQKSTILGAIKKIKNGYIGGARVVLKHLSDFFRTTSISKLELRDENIEDLFVKEGGAMPRLFPQPDTPAEFGTQPAVNSDFIRSRWTKQFIAVHQASLRHRSIILDSTDAGILCSFNYNTTYCLFLQIC
jgi:hypothetical protein